MFQVLGRDWDVHVVLAEFETHAEAKKFMDEFEGDEFPILEIVDTLEMV